jgi:methylenetetrahydrofolate--tRNA-(uracil-5-)-methyltransferase
MFAGQITGTEGYIESASVGLLVGYFASCLLKDITPVYPPRDTALGCQLAHILDDTDIKNYQPMNINFGIFPPVHAFDERGKKIKGTDRKRLYTVRAEKAMDEWIKNI